MGVRSKITKENSSGKTGEDKQAEKLQTQHEVNLENAGILIGHAMETVRDKGLDKSLIEIARIVRQWPALIDKTDPGAFEPPFNATEISAEDTTLDDDRITRGNFSYSGNTYGLVYKTKQNPSSERTTGTITLHENGERVIAIDILEIPALDLVSFRDLNAFKYGKWIENVVLMENEIGLHGAETPQTQ